MPLSRYRVVQTGSGVALDYCGKLFADFGADVIKLEPPGGDPLRSFPPILESGESGVFAWLNTNKRSVTETPEALAALLPGADVLLDGRALTAVVAGADQPATPSAPSVMDRAGRPPTTCEIKANNGTGSARLESGGSDPAALRAAYPGLSVTTISWFGETGPYCDFAATEATVRALGGLVALSGRAEGPPTLATDGQSGIMAGLAAFIATAAGLFGRAEGGRHFSVSAYETAVNVAEYEAAVAWDAGESRKRPGVNRFGRNYPVGIYPTKHGMIGVTIVTPGQWRGICAMLGMPDLARNPRYAVNVDRLAHAHEIDALFQPVWDTRTAVEWFELGLEYKLPLAVVPTMAELLEQGVHRERGAFAPVRIGEAAFEAPVLPQHLTLTPPRAGGTAPLRGDDEAVWYVPPSGGRPSRSATPGTLPLSGLRIVDLTMGWAGPTASRHLSDLGAEIIKVEACQYPDWWRGTDLRADFIAQQAYEKIPWFQLMNRNKLDVTLDLTHPEGAALLKRLVAEADAVIENYSSDVLRKLGLDYSVLRAVRPGLVMLSMPAFGSNNAWSACRGYGSTLEQASGLPTVTGFPDDPPTMNQTAYGDPVGGFNAAAAMMVALLHRQATGQGQNIDLSQVECMLPLVAPAIIEQSAAGFSSPRVGNRHPVFVPQGCFRCAGDDQWIVVSITDDVMWRAMSDLLDRPDLADLTAKQRRGQEAVLEAAINRWTATLGADEAMTIMQSRGIAAGVVRLPFELEREPHLVARGFWHQLDRPFIGKHWLSSSAFREGPAAYPIRRVAPTLGQDNEAILGGRLGLSRAELDRLGAADVIGTIPRPRRAQSDQ
jgi:crotonobetainyl-CoA:carnitine CoA-transferase CaiB-like acyl-CoA transferase